MKFIGLSGVAGAGKDLFFSLLSKRIDCVRISLADELKADVQDWCMENYGIDPVNCSRSEKEIIRPFLVFHGTQKRHKSKGRYWIERLQKSIDLCETLSLTDTEDKTVVVTDIRYDEYDNDEAGWLKDELNGKLIHITQLRHGIPKAPANVEEERNDPKLINKADLRIEWKYIENGQTMQLMPHIDKAVDWFSSVNENKNNRG